MLWVQELITSIEVGLMFGIVAVGIFITFKTINFADMTCDGSFALGAAVSAVAIREGMNPYLALIFAMLCGAGAGLFTGLLNVKGKIAELLSGIIVAYMLYSINLMVMGNAPSIAFVDHETIFSSFGTSAIVVVFIVVIITCVMLSNFGLKLRAVGYNRRFASTYGINVNLMTIAGLAISNALIAAGGSLFTQYQRFCDISGGFGTLIVGLASIVVGTRLMHFRLEPLLVISCIVGSVLYRIFINLALHVDAVGITTQNLNFVTGLIIIVIMIAKGKGGISNVTSK
jgi:putative ABC transport system permease protein